MVVTLLEEQLLIQLVVMLVVILWAVSNCSIFTVSNTTTFRLRYRLGAVNTVATQNEIFGDSNQAETSITFIKLGVI